MTLARRSSNLPPTVASVSVHYSPKHGQSGAQQRRSPLQPAYFRTGSTTSALPPTDTRPPRRSRASRWHLEWLGRRSYSSSPMRELATCRIRHGTSKYADGDAGISNGRDPCDGVPRLAFSFSSSAWRVPVGSIP